jgi:uncharacterized protein (TIGR03067 family)
MQRRIVWLLVGVLVVVLALGSDVPKEYDGATEYVGIEGTWRFMSAEFFNAPGSSAREHIITYRGGTFISTYDNGETYEGSYYLDARNPSHLDTVLANGPLKGKRRKFLYEVDGNTLRVAHKWLGDERVKGFDDTEYVWIFTYRRAK